MRFVSFISIVSWLGDGVLCVTPLLVSVFASRKLPESPERPLEPSRLFRTELSVAGASKRGNTIGKGVGDGMGSGWWQVAGVQVSGRVLGDD
jgi:hypothetical protein